MLNHFNADSEAIVDDQKGLLFGGRRFELGSVFPHKDLKVIPLDLQGLHIAGLIRFDNTKPASVGIYKDPPAKKVDDSKKPGDEKKK